MDTIESIAPSNVKSFSKHMFTMTDSDKGELMNLLQYAFLSVIPIVALNKTIHSFIPDADPEKGSVELVIEVVTQISMLFVGMFFIHRFITFIPTYSGVAFTDMKLVNVVLSFLVIVLSLQTRLGEKVGILTERIVDFVRGVLGMKQENMENVETTQMEQEEGMQHQASPNDSIANAGVRSMVEQQQGPPAAQPTHMPQQGHVMANPNNYNPPQVGNTMQMQQAQPDFAAMHGSGFSSSFSPF